MDIDAFKLIENSYAYHNVEIDGCVWWNEKNKIIAVEKEGNVLYKEKR